MAARPLEQQGVETPPDPGGGLRLVMPYTSRTPLSSNQLQPLLQELCGLSKGAVSLKSVKLSVSSGAGR